MKQAGYQVIARRWRPKTFKELVGQEHIVKTLSNAIEQNRIAHAYLFVGPRGTGKTSTARLFAKSLNCTGGPSITPPEDCPICQAITEGTCMDVIEIDGASNNSVDQIRDLREECQYAPSQAKYKIYIIDEVHMLSTAAFNALLKTLEEPPAHVKFFFATTEANKVLPTIVSRCQRFEFRPIAESVITEKLKTIAKAEGIEAEEAVYLSVARLAAGGMRDAQSILDQLISFCGNNITEEDVLSVYGLASQAEVNATAQAIANSDYGALVTLSKRFSQSGKDLYRILIDLQHAIHEALIHAIQHNNVTSILGASLSTEALMRMLETLKQGEGDLKTGLSEDILFELTLMKTAEAAKTKAIDTLIKQITEGLPTETRMQPETEKQPEPEIIHQPAPKENSSNNPLSETIQADMEELFRAQYKGVRELDLSA